MSATIPIPASAAADYALPPGSKPFGSTSHRTTVPDTAALIGARLQYWSFTVISKFLMAILYSSLISKGLRLSHPETGMKLSKFLPLLEDYELTYHWDLAHISAFILLFLTWFFWFLILQLVLNRELEAMLRDWGWPYDWTKRIVFTIGGIIITVDACVFYRAFNAAIWGQTGFSASALIATLAYVTILVAITFVSIFLGQTVRFLKKGHR